MLSLGSLLLVLANTACQQLPPRFDLEVDNGILVEQKSFDGAIRRPETFAQIFAVPPQSAEEIQRITRTYDTNSERTRAVLAYIFSFADHGLQYDSLATRTATETLEIGKANCLSLAILTYSLAKLAGLDPVFQEVKIPEYWISENNLSMLSGHVNLRIKRVRIPEQVAGTVMWSKDLIVDFNPFQINRKFRSWRITPARIAAMFYNNKAAQAFANADTAQAYAYFRAAIDIDPGYAPAWSNLGVLYRQQHLTELAERAYNQALVIAPDSNNTLANLAVLYRQQNRPGEASAIGQRIHRLRQENPYYHVMLGNEAYSKAHFRQAVNHFKKSLDLDKENHEAYFGLAKSYFTLEQPQMALRYMKKAKRSAFLEQDQIRYSGKLAVLQNLVSMSN